MAFGFSSTPAPQLPQGNGGGVPLYKSYQELKTGLHRDLLNKIDLERLTSLQDVRAQTQVQTVIYELIGTSNVPLSGTEKEQICREVLHEVFGLGPLEPLLQDSSITDILVNSHRQVFVERGGLLELTNVVFKDAAHLRHIIDKIVSNVGRRGGEMSPMCQSRPDGGLPLKAIFSPPPGGGPGISICPFRRTPFA